jgi:hypothetical protein
VAREGYLALAEGFAPSRSGRRHFVVCWPSFAAAAAVVRAAAVGDSEPRRTSSMLRKTVAFLFLAGLATAASAQTADDLIEKNIHARGGRVRLKAVQTIRMTGKMSLGKGMEAPMTIEMVPPSHKLRMDFTLQGVTGTQAFDGSDGWQVMPFKGDTGAVAMSPEDLTEMRDTADFQGAFFDYKEKGNKVEYLGKADFAGTPAYKLKLTEKDGGVTTILLDAESYLELAEESAKIVGGAATVLETSFGDYRSVEGISFPFTIEVKAKGLPSMQTFSIDKVELNVEVPANRFEMPKVGTKPEATQTGAPPPGA